MDNVSNLEVKNCLRESMELNVIAIDFIEEELKKYEDRLKYNEDDEEAKYNLNCLKYIKFSLYYLDRQYMKAFRKCGGKL